MTNVVSFEQKSRVASAIKGDAPNLFSLADKVLAAAESQRWGVWVSDARSSYFLSQFMSTVYAASDKVAGDPPLIIPIANSRTVRSNPHHQQAVMNRLAQSKDAIEGNNALILSEYAVDRRGLSKLCAPLRKVGAVAVDAAVLNLDYLSRNARLTDQPDTIYKGEPYTYEPHLFSGVLKEAVGQMCVAGVAEPLDAPDADLALREHVSDAIDTLAQQYIAQNSLIHS